MKIINKKLKNIYKIACSHNKKDNLLNILATILKAKKFQNIGIEEFTKMITNPNVMGNAVVNTKYLSDSDIQRMYNSVQENSKPPPVNLSTVRGAIRRITTVPTQAISNTARAFNA